MIASLAARRSDGRRCGLKRLALPVIADPSHGGIGGHHFGPERKGGFATTHEEHLLPHPGANRVDGNELRPEGLTGGIHRLEHQ